MLGGIPRQKDFRSDGNDGNGNNATYVFDSYDGMTLSIRTRRPAQPSSREPSGANPLLALAVQPDSTKTFSGGGPSRPNVSSQLATAAVEVRNTGISSVGPGYLWTARRSYPLLGETLPERQVSDLLAGIALLRHGSKESGVAVYGQGYTAPLAIYAALLDQEITEVVLSDPPSSHEASTCPEFLGVLRVGDLPHNLALVFPRPITFIGKIPAEFEWTKSLYGKLGQEDRVRVVRSAQEWTPYR